MIKIYAQSPNEKAVARVADVLRSDGVIVYPTDSVYAFGCSIRSPKGRLSAPASTARRIP